MREIAILGAGGLTGREIIRILRNHPKFTITHITSEQHVGKSLQEAYPNEIYPENLIFQHHKASVPKGATVILATPNEASLELSAEFLEKGQKVIDLSGVFRLHDKEVFEQSYKIPHSKWDLVQKAIYGLPEFFRNSIHGSEFVSNPGCYATASIVPLRILKEALQITDWEDCIVPPVVIDAKSGVSGAGGRTEDTTFSFTNTYENFRAYKVLSHQHEPEIREYGMGTQYLKKEDILVFTPHLLPLYRGILVTICIQWRDSKTASRIGEILKSKCSEETFLRYRNTPEEIELRKVQTTNFLDISSRTRGNISIILAAIDNLVKGAAGQAVQNLNLMHGLEESLALI